MKFVVFMKQVNLDIIGPPIALGYQMVMDVLLFLQRFGVARALMVLTKPWVKAWPLCKTIAKRYFVELKDHYEQQRLLFLKGEDEDGNIHPDLRHRINLHYDSNYDQGITDLPDLAELFAENVLNCDAVGESFTDEHGETNSSFDGDEQL